MADYGIYSTLLFKYFQDTLTAEENETLQRWIHADPAHLALFEELSRDEKLGEAISEYHPDNRLALEGRILHTIRTRVSEKPAVVPFFNRTIFRVAAAAGVAALLVLGYYQFFSTRHAVIENPVVKKEFPADIKAPETNRATITLADGREVFLDSVGSGQLAVQGNVKLVKLANGQIAYETADGGRLTEVRYNTLTNPRGSRVIDMILADGTHVWLNAGSSITFPVAFIGDQRKVSFTGEAYFEVTRDEHRPFYVEKGRLRVEVLGTRFNINAYDDDDDINVTLVEGSVKTSAGNLGSVVLKPGEQARIGEEIEMLKGVDTDAVVAWKNGVFSFSQADLKTIMRQIARWYDVEVIYDAPVPQRKFGGEISRMSSVSNVLRVLEESDIKFRIDGRKITITR